MESRPAKRYARALFNLSREQDSLDEVRSDIETLSQLLERNETFRHFTTNPLIPADQRARTLTAL
nr:F0F1 ATP synthase subunit delta [Akkermansiaceae bacterium]